MTKIVLNHGRKIKSHEAMIRNYTLIIQFKRDLYLKISIVYFKIIDEGKYDPRDE